MKRTPLIALAAAAALLAGCQTTPTEPPKLDLPPATVQALDLDRWWTGFNDPDLERLVDEALANNLDLASAMTRIDQARAAVLLASSSQYPSANLNAGPSRQRRWPRAGRPVRSAGRRARRPSG